MCLLCKPHHLSPMIDSAEFGTESLYSIYSPVAYRLLFISLILSSIFYLGVFLVNFLVIRDNKPPIRQDATLHSLSPQLDCSLISVRSSLYSLLSEKSLASTPLLNLSLLGLLKSRNIRSPTPDGSDSPFFDHRAFYQTLNNSSHYLRRDSFTT